MGSRKVAFKPSPDNLYRASTKLRAAYEYIVEAETLAMGYNAYSDIHGLASRCVHTMEKAHQSFEAIMRARKAAKR